MALIEKLEAIGDAIRAKTGKSELLTLDAMPTEIGAIETGGGELPEEAFVISGNCSYKFGFTSWNWFFDLYKDRITTINITNANSLFNNNAEIEFIPFDINLASNNSQYSCAHIFAGMTKLKTAPYIKGTVESINNCFYGCYGLKYIPEDWANHIDWSYINSYLYATCGSIFYDCRSLRHIPASLLSSLWGTGTGANAVPYINMCYGCYTLDELCGLAVHQGTLTSNRSSSMLNYCYRLKNFTFATNGDGTCKTANWKSQTIDLSSDGYSYSSSYILDYNSDITADKEVKDDATYQALKDNPDWWTIKVEYSRYNHDSAVETINSLPDTSAYLATAGGTNTIKFKGAAGSATDGGAINTLTEEEIAVATAKGWTVTFA